MTDNGFTTLITVDENLVKREDIGASPIAVVLLRAVRNTIDELVPLVPATLALLPTLVPGQYVEVGLLGGKP